MEVPRMNKEELRSRLNNPETIVIDVRKEQKDADTKIQGAVLREPDKLSTWADNYPKDKTLVLYCS